VPLVAGVDCSTQGTKVLIVNSDDGQVVATGVASHEVEGEGGARETSPAVWGRALADALGETGLADRVEAISVGGQQHGLVVLGASGEPLCPAPLWNDTRSAPDAAALVTALGGPQMCAERVGSVLTAAFTVAHWAWLRRVRPEVAAAAARVMLPHDYLNFRLTGEAATDRSDVSGTGWWSPREGSYAHDVLDLELVGLGIAALPAVVGPQEVAGKVTRTAATDFGLSEGVPVACGAGDNAAAALPLALGEGEMAMSLGTSGTVYAASSSPSADPSGTVAGFASADGRFLPLACTLNATLAVDRACEWLNLAREDVAPSNGVVFLPWLGGERTPNVPTATGTLTGLNYKTDGRSILQAAYEGIVATLLEAAGALGDWAPQDPAQPVLLVGGGARGRVWQETVRRLSGRPVLVVELSELVAYGAAMQAGALVTGASLAELSKTWGGRKGAFLEPARKDEATMGAIAAWRSHVLASLEGGRGSGTVATCE